MPLIENARGKPPHLWLRYFLMKIKRLVFCSCQSAGNEKKDRKSPYAHQVTGIHHEEGSAKTVGESLLGHLGVSDTEHRDQCNESDEDRGVLERRNGLRTDIRLFRGDLCDGTVCCIKNQSLFCHCCTTAICTCMIYIMVIMKLILIKKMSVALYGWFLHANDALFQKNLRKTVETSNDFSP